MHTCETHEEGQQEQDGGDVQTELQNVDKLLEVFPPL